MSTAMFDEFLGDALPPEILLKIFKCVANAEDLVACNRVSRRWYDISKEEKLWNRLSIQRFGNCRVEAYGNNWRKFYRGNHYHTRTLNKILVRLNQNENGNKVLFTVNPDGTDQKVIATFDNSSETFQQPTWSPRCDKIAISVYSSNKSYLMIFDLDGVAKSKISTQNPAFYIYWSPDNTRITILSSYLRNYQNSIALQHIDTVVNRSQEEGQELPIKFIDAGMNYFYTWCPLDASPRLVAHVSSEKLVLIEIHPDSNKPIIKHLITPSGEPGPFSVPIWTKQNEVIYLIRTGSSTSLIAGTFTDPPTYEDLKNAPTQELKKLLESHGISTSTCLEKEDLVRTALSEFYEKYVIMKEEVILKNLSIDNRGFLVSPDGNRIAFVDQKALKVVDRSVQRKRPDDPTAGVHMVANSKSTGFFWSPNSRYLMYLIPFDHILKVQCFIFDANCQENNEVITFNMSMEFSSNYLPFFCQYAQNVSFFSPDSESFLICKQGRQPEIWVCSVHKGHAPVRVATGNLAVWSPV